MEVAEERLIEQLSVDDNKLLKPALQFHVSRPIEPLVLRVLSLIAFLQLCSDHYATIGFVADGVPARTLEARQCIIALLYAKRLQLRVNTDDQLELGAAMLALLSGGSSQLPVTIPACELYRRWGRSEAGAAKRRAKETVVAGSAAAPTVGSISGGNCPDGKW